MFNAAAQVQVVIKVQYNRPVWPTCCVLYSPQVIEHALPEISRKSAIFLVFMDVCIEFPIL